MKSITFTVTLRDIHLKAKAKPREAGLLKAEKGIPEDWELFMVEKERDGWIKGWSDHFRHL